MIFKRYLFILAYCLCFSLFSDSVKMTVLPYKQDDKWGFFDTVKNKIVIPVKYEQVQNFNEGLAPVFINGKWGFINTKGILVIEPKFNMVKLFHDSLAAVKLGKSWNYINKNGEIVLKTSFDRVGNFFNGLAMFKKDHQWGYINKKGDIVIPAQFRLVNIFSKNGLSSVMKNNKWFFIDKTGKQVFDKHFDDARPFICGFAPVQVNKNWGFINDTGTIVIQPQYEQVEFFQNDTARVKKNGQWIRINKKGEIVTLTGEINKELEPKAPIDKASKKTSKNKNSEIIKQEYFELLRATKVLKNKEDMQRAVEIWEIFMNRYSEAPSNPWVKRAKRHIAFLQDGIERKTK